MNVVPAVDVPAAGPSYSVVRLSEALRREGVESRIAALRWTESGRDSDHVKLFPVGWGPKRLGNSPLMYAWMKREARAGRVGLIHNHGLWMMPNVYPGWVARRSRIPYLVSPRGTLGAWPFRSGAKVKRVFWPLVQKPALASVSCWHATGENEYEDIRRMGFRQPVAVVPNGMDLPPPFPKRRKEGRVLLFLGRLHPKKGLDWLIQAWSRVESRFQEWKLSIAGPDWGCAAELRSLAEGLVPGRVEFRGPLYGEDKWKAYAEADVFVLPTRHENFGLVVAEALASGTPAIVSRNAPWEGLERRQCGWWIEAGVEPLAACLEQALSLRPERLEAMGRAGREWVKEEFSWDSVGRRMAAVYRWMVGEGERPGDVRVG